MAVDNKREALKKNPLYVAIKQKDEETVKSLLAAKAEISTELLFTAVKVGYWEVVEELLTAKADVKAVNDKGETLLMAAIKRRRHLVITKLLEVNANVNAVDQRGWTPLSYAAYLNEGDMISELVESKADVEAVTIAGKTSLLLAIKNNSLRAIATLIETRADIQAADAEGITPLMAAIEKDSALAEYLLNAKANIHIADKQGDTPLKYAARHNREPIVRELLKRKVNKEAGAGASGTPLWEAAQHGCLESLEALLEVKAEVDTANADGVTPLMCAIEMGHEAIVKRLLKANAKVNTLNNNHFSPLGYAAHHGREAAIKQLLKAKAKADVKEGEPPLFLAVRAGHEAIVNVLLKAKANVQALPESHLNQVINHAPAKLVMKLLDAKINLKSLSKDNREKILACMVEEGREKDIRQLLHEKTIPKIHDHRDPLINAVLFNPELIALLLEAKAEVSVPGRMTPTEEFIHSPALQMAVMLGRPAIVEQLIARKADTNKPTSILFWAIQNAGLLNINKGSQAGKFISGTDEEYLKVLQILIEAKADLFVALTMINDAGSEYLNKLTPVLIKAKASPKVALYTAATLGDHTLVAKLIDEEGVDLNAEVDPNHKYPAPLMAAIVAKHTAIVSLLLSKKAEVKSALALFLAVKVNQKEIVQLLLDAKADPKSVDPTRTTSPEIIALLKQPLCVPAPTDEKAVGSVAYTQSARMNFSSNPIAQVVTAIIEPDLTIDGPRPTELIVFKNSS